MITLLPPEMYNFQCVKEGTFGHQCDYMVLQLKVSKGSGYSNKNYPTALRQIFKVTSFMDPSGDQIKMFLDLVKISPLQTNM